MTKIANIKDLKVGDKVTVTVEGRISHVYPEDNYANLDFAHHAEYIPISDEYLDDGIMVVDRPRPPLPARNGIYIPANNASTPESSYLYIYDDEDEDEDGPWTQFNGSVAITGLAAQEEAEHSHNA